LFANTSNGDDVAAPAYSTITAHMSSVWEFVNVFDPDSDDAFAL